MSTEDKIRFLLTKLSGQSNQKFLKDLQERGLTYGSYTTKQSEMIDGLYDRVTKVQPDGIRKYALGEIQPRGIAKCWDCGDSGFVRLTRKQEFEEWARWSSGSAPCHCPRGAELISAAARRSPPLDLGPQFNDLWKTSYSINPSWHEDDGRVTRDDDNRIHPQRPSQSNQ